MKVLMVNTFPSGGGAAIAARRLARALGASGVEVNSISMKRRGFSFYWERFVIWVYNRFSRKNLFKVSLANAGEDITRLPEFRNSDVIHLHWINQGFLSTGSLDKIFRSGKPVVWTLHDMWPVTGICHHSEDCCRFETKCSLCPLLAAPGPEDLSSKVFSRKAELYPTADVTFVGCSEWIAARARHSALVSRSRVRSIPNPIDTELFSPGNGTAARKTLGLPLDKKLILFCCAKTTDPKKGIGILLEALKPLADRCPDAGLVILGAGSESLPTDGRLPVYPLPFERDERRMAEIYRAVDLYVTPSLLDNLPNTVMEALSCGVPCVGFEVGGIPEMIDDGMNGYIAKTGSSVDLAAKMEAALDSANYGKLAAGAREKALRCYSEAVVAGRMKALYEELTEMKDAPGAPLFSIVTVTYNAERTLPRTLESVASQNFSDFEHIIVDGASSDSTASLAREYAASRPNVRVISERDRGIYDAMNKGLSLASGRYVCFLNAGDAFRGPSALGNLARKIASSEPDVIYGDTVLVDSEGRELGPRRPATAANLDWRSFRRGMVVSHQAFFVRTALARRVPYDLRYRFSSDQDWCIRVMRRARSIVNSGLVLIEYLCEGASTANRRASLFERFEIYRSHYGLPQTIISHIYFILRLPFLK